MSDQVSTSEIQATWESAAPGWAKWEAEFSKHLGDVTEKLLDMAGISSQMLVLDLACGAGNQTIQAAERVGEQGGVTACDISAEMLKHVRMNAERSGLKSCSMATCRDRLVSALAMQGSDGLNSRRVETERRYVGCRT